MELQKLIVNLRVCHHVAFEVKSWASMTAAGKIMQPDIQEMSSAFILDINIIFVITKFCWGVWWRLCWGGWGFVLHQMSLQFSGSSVTLMLRGCCGDAGAQCAF